LLGANLGATLVFPRVEQVDFVRMLVQKNLMHVLNGYQAFRGWNASRQAFGDGGLAGASLAEESR
jgi:hypothetical protein